MKTAKWPRNVLLAVLAIVALATGIGLHSLWPDHAKVAKLSSKAQFAAPGVTFPKAEITKIQKGCNTGAHPDEPPDPSMPAEVSACDLADVKILTGAQAGSTTRVQLQGPMTTSGLTPGDQVELMAIPDDPSDGAQADARPSGQEATAGPTDSVFGIVRSHSLGILAIAFVVIVLLVALIRGLMALVALAFSGFMLIKFILPALLTGGPGLQIALVGAAAIMFVILYLAHGPSTRTSVALAGTLCGIGITAAIAEYAVRSTRLSGFNDESSGILSVMGGSIDFRGLLTCAIVIAGLGVLNDVTITQASAVWELRAAGPGLPRRRLFTSAMRIGRDHIASTIYTIVFAYAGAAMSVLLLLYLYDRPYLDLLTQEDIATEVVRTLCSAIGLVLAVPLTTAIATVLAPPEGDSDQPARVGRSDMPLLATGDRDRDADMAGG